MALRSAEDVRRPVLILEFNELCPSLLDKWMSEGWLPNFERLRDQSAAFVTDADVTDPAQLEPWIQWYSVHTGLAYDQHRVFHLTEGAKACHPDIYSTLLNAGRRVGSFASMNVKPFAAPGSFFVGDPWSESGDASPTELNLYNRFVSHNVREYSNSRNRLGLADYGRFLSFMMRHGLHGATVAMILKQLASEKFTDPRLSFKRVALLDRMQLDVFRHYYRRTRPDLATFFINSTAHLQHSYWRHMEPEAFRVRPSAAEMAVYRDAVRFGYQSMDRLVGEFIELADSHGATLIFMTALSQQPFLRHEETGGQHFYRLYDVGRFLDRLGIGGVVDIDPTMTHQYLARFTDAAARNAARRRLTSLALEDGRQLFGFATIDARDNELYFGCQISTKITSDAAVLDGDTRIPFKEALYQIEAIKSGRHHPEGALWVRGGWPCRHQDHVSILDVFPTLLDMLEVEANDGLPRRGRSLLPLLQGHRLEAVAA